VVFGTDRFSALVQWFGYIGSILVLSCLVPFLSRKNAPTTNITVAAIVFFATLPMALLQATSTQTDLISTFWVILCVYYLLIQKPRFFASAFALAIFTKTSNALYLAPFCIWGLYYLYRSGIKMPQLLLKVGFLFGLTAAIHGPHFYRNYVSFGSFAGPAKEVSGMNNDTVNPAMTLANVVRNYSLNLGTPVSAINDALTTTVRKSLAAVGMDADDPRYSFGSQYRFEIGKTSTHEDHAPNPYQAWMLLLFIPVFFLAKSKTHSRLALTYGILTLLSFYTLCVFLRASPWNHRLHLPFFALSAPLFGLVACTLKSALNANIVRATLVVASIASFYWSLCNYSKPVLRPKSHYPTSILSTTRAELYFHNRPYLKLPYLQSIEKLKASGCHHLGIIIGLDHWEYPLWALAKLSGHGLTVSHVNGFRPPVDHLPLSKAAPCALFIAGEQKEPITVDGISFTPITYYPGEYAQFTYLEPASPL
jgi:hypothetical protein